MNEDPLQIIEAYLMLVRSHLLASTAEDVIDELRDYLVDAATELGEGVVTAKSAKRAVARMGAPSEVAAEYTASLIAEAEPRLVGEADTDELASLPETEGLQEVGGGVIPSLAQGRELSPVERTTYKSAIARVLLILGLLSLVVSMTYLGAGLVLLELPVAVAILGTRLGQLHQRRDSLMRVSYCNQVKRLFSVPRKLDIFVSRSMVLFDLSLTVVFTMIMLAGFVVRALEPFSAIAVFSLLIVRTVLLVLRTQRSPRHLRHIMRMLLLVQIAIAMAVNLAAGVHSIYHYWYAFGYSLIPVVTTIAVILAAYMLAVSTMQIDCLWGLPESDESPMVRRGAERSQTGTLTDSSSRSLLKLKPECPEAASNRPALRLGSIFFSWLSWMFLSLALLPIGLAALGGTATWTPERTAMIWIILGWICLLAFLVMWPVVIYLVVRWAFLKRGRSEVLVGFRSVPEAVVDCIATAFLIVLVLYTCFSWPFQSYLSRLATEYSTPFRYRLLVAVCIVLMSGLILRLASNILNAVNHDSMHTSWALRLSCLLVLAAIGGFLGETVLTYPYYGFYSYYMTGLWSTPPAAFLCLQAATSKIKFRRLKSSGRVGSVLPQMSSTVPRAAPTQIETLFLLRRKTVSLALVWPFVLFFTTLFVVDAVVLATYSGWQVVILISIVYTGLVGALMIVYFAARRAMICAAEASTVIGGRGRAEAALDLVLIILALSASVFYPNMLNLILEYSTFSINMSLALLFEAMFWGPVVVGALLRAAADLASIVSRRRVIPRTVFLLSGILLLGGIAFVIPLHLAILDLSWTAFWLAISVLLDLQVVTSVAALEEISLQQRPTNTGEPRLDGYPSGMAFPTN